MSEVSFQVRSNRDGALNARVRDVAPESGSSRRTAQTRRQVGKDALPLFTGLRNALRSPAYLSALAAVAVAAGMSVNFGQFAPSAIAWVMMGAMLAMVAVVRSGDTAPADPSGVSAKLWWAPLGLCVAMLLGRGGPIPVPLPDAVHRAWIGCVVMTAIGAAVAAGSSGRLRRFAVGVMLAAFVAGGAIVLRATPAPAVDIVVFQQDAADALLAGRSPYGITFPDISPAGSNFYADGVSVAGRLQFGFPYPPLSLFLVLPFHLLGDFRFAGLLATAATAGLLCLGNRSRHAPAVAAILLLSPMTLFVIWAGWTEPMAALLLVGIARIASRLRVAWAGVRACPWLFDVQRTRAGEYASPCHPSRSVIPLVIVLGLFLAVKQYAVVLLPLVALLVPRGRRLAVAAGAVGVAGIVTLPLALTDWSGFLRSVVTLQFHQPFRADALSLIAPLHGTLPKALAGGLAFVAAGAATVWTIRRSPYTPAGFALAASVVLLAFFALNKQAFCNYYYLVLAGLVAGAVMGAEGSRLPTPTPTPTRTRTRTRTRLCNAVEYEYE